MTATEFQPVDTPRLSPTEARAHLSDLATEFDDRAGDTTNQFDDRVRYAEISAAIGWALKAETGTVTLGPDHLQTLEDYRRSVRYYASSAQVLERRWVLDLVLDRIAAIDHAICQAPKRPAA